VVRPNSLEKKKKKHRQVLHLVTPYRRGRHGVTGSVTAGREEIVIERTAKSTRFPE
jgi:hypothetical protein